MLVDLFSFHIEVYSHSMSFALSSSIAACRVPIFGTCSWLRKGPELTFCGVWRWCCAAHMHVVILWDPWMLGNIECQPH